MWKPSEILIMIDEQRRTLDTWVRSGSTPQRIAMRARICLLAATGISNNSISKQLGISRPTVILWRKRFQADGPSGLAKDAPHGPSPQRLDSDKVKAIVDATLQTTPPDATHSSTRTMAKAQGVSHATIGRRNY